MTIHYCHFCRARFEPSRPNAERRFCSTSCASKWNWQNNPRLRDARVAANNKGRDPTEKQRSYANMKAERLRIREEKRARLKALFARGVSG